MQSVPHKPQDKHTIYKSINSLLIIGREIDANKHSHHALQISIALDEAFHFECDAANGDFNGVIIGPNISHSLSGPSGRQALLLLDPEHYQAQHIIDHWLAKDGFCEIEPELFTQIRRHIDALLTNTQPGPQPIADILDILAPPNTQPDGMDARIQGVIDYIGERSQKLANIQELAEKACLSESRLAHLFKQQVGIPIRRYLLWQRLLDACFYAAAGASLTEAAHKAGFTDSSHFNRTFKSMFGVHPSTMMKQSGLVELR